MQTRAIMSRTGRRHKHSAPDSVAFDVPDGSVRVDVVEPADGNHRVHSQRQRRTAPRGRRARSRTRSGRARACACSTTRPTRRTTDRCSRSPATPRRRRRATLALFEHAVAAIDLRTHRGEHPRLGAVDVVPFVPIEGVTMAECVALAKEVGAAVADRFGVPVYLYEEASTNPARKNLEDIRRGEFEGLAAKMATAGWAPDFGPAAPHPSAGAVGDRRAHAAHRLQHQPEHRPARRRQEDRRRDPPQQRRPALRQGDWASRSRIAASSRCR